jgi:hypothetical protein
MSLTAQTGGCFSGCWFLDSMRFGAAPSNKQICNELILLHAAAGRIAVRELGTDF